MSLSLYDLFVSMGLFAKSIVIILAAMSIYSWTSAFQKLYQILRSQGETRRFAPEFSRFLKEDTRRWTELIRSSGIKVEQ